jgi:hypothetical protein
MENGSPMFVDVQTLLEASQPRPRVAWVAYFMGAALVSLLSLGFLADRSTYTQETAEGAGSAILVMLVVGTFAVNYFQARARRVEQARLEAAEELVQLRRWPQAAFLLQSILSRPTQSPVGRLQALVYLSSVLARFHRFDDVIAIDDHVLQTMPLETPAAHMVKLARGMALLREDRLFDADRAISDLRRTGRAAESGGLAILELYRDVKTGHPTEALALFAKRRELIAQQLGHRLADAFILAAKAHDMLNQPDQAKAAFQSATLLAPVMELYRRYPETADLSAKYPLAPAPAEVAA